MAAGTLLLSTLALPGCGTSNSQATGQAATYAACPHNLSGLLVPGIVRRYGRAPGAQDLTKDATTSISCEYPAAHSSGVDVPLDTSVSNDEAATSTVLRQTATATNLAIPSGTYACGASDTYTLLIINRRTGKPRNIYYTGPGCILYYVIPGMGTVPLDNLPSSLGFADAGT